MRASRVVRRKEHLFSTIEQSKGESKQLELLIETEEGKQQEVAKALLRLGKVERVYELFPFIALRCGPGVAEQLANCVHNKEVSRSFGSSYYGVLRVIKAVDVSSKYSIVPSPGSREADVYLDLKVQSLWNLRTIGAYDAQKLSTGSGINIGIIDTGTDYNHPQLRSRFEDLKGYDFVDESFDPMDKEGHGTHVSGTACSQDYGVSLESTLYAVRVLDENGAGFESDVIAGVEWCIKNNIDVVNMSLGSRDASRAFEQICKLAYQNGVLLVAAAGNEGHGPSYPASFDEYVIAVAAIDKNDEHADFSNIWETNDISAPGVGIMSCYPGGGYRILDGTSMATPHETGAAALAMALALADLEYLELLMDQTAEHLDYDGNDENSWVFGSGKLRVDRLVNKILYDKRFRNGLKKRHIYKI